MPQDKKNPFDQVYQAPDNPFDRAYSTTETGSPALRSENPFDVAYEPTTAQRVLGTVAPYVAPVVDVLSRGQYASARFFDSLIGDVQRFINDDSFSFSDFFSKRREETKKALGEIISPEQRLSFSDVIERRAPEFAKNHPTATSVLGFAGDVALDPTTYLGVGLAGKGIRVGGKVLTAEGKKLLDRTIELSLKNAVEELPGRVTKHEYQRLESHILKLMAEELPEKAQALGKPASAFIVPAGPRLTFAGKQITPALSREVFERIGLESLYDSVAALPKRLKDIPGISQTRRIFSRNADLPQEYVDLRRVAENNLNYIATQVIQDTRKLFQDIPRSEKNAIADAMFQIEKRKRELSRRSPFDDVSNSLNRPLTDEEVVSVYREVIHNSASNISPQGKAILAGLHQNLKAAVELETSVDTLGRLLNNPAMYEIIEDPGVLRRLLGAKKTFGFADDLSAKDISKYFTKEELESRGFLPELDAAALYATRFINARQAASKADFQNSVKAMFNVNSLDDLPKSVKDDLRFFGDGLYSPGMSETALSIIKTLDKAQNLWKRGATVAKVPQFAIKQLLGNTMQGMLVTGARALRGLDPRAGLDAALFLMQRPLPKALPRAFRDFIEKVAPGADTALLAERAALSNVTGRDRLFQFAKDFKKRSAIGEDLFGEKLYGEMLENGIIKGFDQTGESLAKSVKQEVNKEFGSKQVVGELAKFWQWPSMIEDYGRALNYINARMMGYSPLEAQKVVNKALFDYEHGLSLIEKRVLKRLIPFYSFNRFVIPLTLKGVIERPGLAIAPTKLFKLFENLISGEDLTPEQREILPGYLIEQPHVLRGYDREGRAVFSTVNNIAPLEVFNLIQFKKDGSVDWEETARRSIGAALTPYIKVPMELVANEKFFSQQVIDRARLAPADPRRYWRMTKDGRQVGQIAAALPDPIKELIGYEVKKERDGKMTAYINPYVTYLAMEAFPFLRAYVNPITEEETPLTRAMSLLFGASTREISFPQEARRRVREQQGQIQLTRRKVVEAQKVNDHERARKVREELRQLLQELQQFQKQRAALLQQARDQQESFPPIEPTFVR